jgi:hypothetical protein
VVQRPHPSITTIDRYAIDRDRYAIDRGTLKARIRFQTVRSRRRRIGTFAHDDVDDDDDDDDDRAPDGDARATRDRGARCGCASDDGATGT